MTKLKSNFQKYTLFTLAILFSNLIFAQEIIPFRLTKYNNILVKTLVNKKDSLELMFQIAMEDASISPERLRPAESIVFHNEISENNSIKIGDLAWENIKFFDNELTGQEADGKIGTGIFKGKTYQIDYDNNHFVLYDTLPDLKGYVEVSYTKNKHGQVFISCDNIIDNQSYSADFLMQSGYPGGLLYSNDFADDNELALKIKVTGEKTLKNSANQSVTTKNGILQALQINGIMMKDVSAGFFTGEIKNQHVSYFGADLIKRFNWIFDAKNSAVYIKPSKYFHDPYFKIK